jgi:hypothetical protein
MYKNRSFVNGGKQNGASTSALIWRLNPIHAQHSNTGLDESYPLHTTDGGEHHVECSTLILVKAIPLPPEQDDVISREKEDT